MQRPDFLCIGAQKAGTSWLWSNLRRHPDVWMPPVKELHYFDRSRDYPSPNWHAPTSPLGRLIGGNAQASEFRSQFVKRLRSDVGRRDAAAIRWDLKYFLNRPGDRWYTELFRPGGDRVKGEITPSYAILDRDDVRRVHDLLPNAKILFVMRNPLDRAWSQVRFAGLQDASFEDTTAYIDSPSQALRSDYLRTIDIWTSAYPEAQFHMLFYDDLSAHPLGFLQSVCAILGVPAERMDLSRLESVVYASPTKKAPEAVEAYLAQKYVGELRTLSTTFGGHATAWLRSAEQRSPRV